MKKTYTITVLLAALLIIVVAIGGTLAYLNATDEALNKFTFVNGTGDGDNDLKAELDEPNWDEEEGLNVTPGSVVAKDPLIRNTSTADMDEYAAIRITYQKLSASDVATDMSASEVTALLNVMSINYNTIDWTKDTTFINANDNGVIYYYNTTVGCEAPDNETVPLFTTVTIDSDADNDDIAAIAAFAPGGIYIKVEAAVVQAANLTASTAQAPLAALFN